VAAGVVSHQQRGKGFGGATPSEAAYGGEPNSP
jgi:hypothetical protein